jgi:sulfonate transport system permease protein
VKHAADSIAATGVSDRSAPALTRIRPRSVAKKSGNGQDATSSLRRPLTYLSGLPRWVRRALGPLLLLALWWGLSATGVLHDNVLAGPPAIAQAAWALAESGDLLNAIVVSLHRVLIGLSVGASVGTLLAILSGPFRLGEDLIDAPMQMLRTIPHIALIPLLIIWFGIGETPKVGLIALASAFPLYLNVYAGIRQADTGLIEAGRTLDLSRIALIRLVVLPGALPNFLVGLRYAFGASWLALVFGEQINATAGIGYLLSNARELFQTDVIVVCLIIYALLGLAADLMVRLLEKILLSWRPTFTGT